MCTINGNLHETASRHVTSHAILKFYVFLKLLPLYELPCNEIATEKLRAIKLKD